MIINYALVGSDTNPMYLDFWPIISKVWKKRFNITPVLGLICDEETKPVEDENGIVIKVKKIPGFSDALLSQLVRLYLPKFLKGNCIVSDIDMIPLSKKYFIDEIKKYSDNDFLVLSSHHHQTVNKNQYPMCYVVGSDSNYKKIFGLEDGWETFIKKIPNNGWYTDQVFLYESINRTKNVSYKFPQRENGFVQNRIDRINWNYDITKLQKDFYVDSHSLRPYQKHKVEIDKLVNLLIK